MITADQLQQSIRDFVNSFESEAPALVAEIESRQAREVLGSFGEEDPDVLRAAAAVGVAVALSAMRMPPQATATAAPDAAVREARGVVAAGGSLAALLQSYRIGHAVIQEQMLIHAERTRTPIGAVRVMSERLFNHIDSLMKIAQQEFMEERRRRNAAVDLSLYQQVTQMLAGEDVDLPYPMDDDHLAIVFDPDAPPDAAEQLVKALARPSLRVVARGREIWLWLAVPAADADVDVRSELEAIVGVGSAGISGVARGRAGMAVAHRQAAVACRLGTLRGTRVCVYNEVALEALAFGGQDAARDFARAELGLLAEDGERTETLRQTVQTYFANGSSAAATAAALGIAERTVTYRLRRAEELVGRPLSARRAEIEAALRLYRVLDRVA
jgi:hypothetical protein